MAARIASDGVLVVHLAFIAFAVFGGFLVLRWRRLMLMHLPAVAWAAFVEATGSICPLTLVENRLRAAAGLAGYADDFVGHYLVSAIYPAGLTRATQVLLAVLVIVVNAAVYGAIARSKRQRLADA